MEKHVQVIQDKADQIYEKFKSFFAFQVLRLFETAKSIMYFSICDSGRRCDFLGGV